MSENDLKKRKLKENYPKICQTCGKSYGTYAEFIENTVELNAGDLGQGPGQSVLVYRNCSCGSTITSKVADMRDYSEAGEKQRAIFREKLKEYLEVGFEEKEAIRLVKKELGIP